MNGSLHMVSIGPGLINNITPAAQCAIEKADVIVAYDLYLTFIKPWLDGKEIVTFPLTEERARALAALGSARQGKRAVIVSSGDIGVYGMASLVFEELQESDSFEVKVIPGITSANACASLLGAPLAHDFMTLSLSDLLCPWDWIEQRAGHAAEADLCMALYNVASKKRPDGIYRILKLISQFKGSNTVCGIVRNAYRPEQSIKIMTLGELGSQPFDMLTTVIIGNKFTKHKQNWMYTPRGYNQWQEQPDPQHLRPEGAVWVFSGTSDGNELANAIAEQGLKVVLSAATEYGAKLAAKSCPAAQIIFGKAGKQAREQLIKDSKARAIVDATHPYADTISGQLIEISRGLDLPYIRFERAPSNTAYAHATVCTDLKAALQEALPLGKRIFLAIGSKLLDSIDVRTISKDHQLFVRITPDLESIAKALKSGIDSANIIAMQGPFSQEMNMAIWRDKAIEVVITKESGSAGGFDEKVRAAEALGIKMIVIARPAVNYPRIAHNYQEVLQAVAKAGSAL